MKISLKAVWVFTPVYRNASALLVTLKTDVGISRTIPSKIQSYLAVGKPIIGALDGEGGSIDQKIGWGNGCSRGR
jgi:hypothetical protein